MQKQLTLSVSPEMAADENLLKQCVRDELGLKTDSVLTVKLRKRSVDSRSRKIRVNLSIEVFIDEVPDPVNFPYPYRDADPTNSVAIIGAGPAGLFAALKLLEHGIRPVIFERGKDVRARRRDRLAAHVDTGIELLDRDDGPDVALLTRGRQRAAFRTANGRRVAAGAVDRDDKVATFDRGDVLLDGREERGCIVQKLLKGRKIDLLQDGGSCRVIKRHDILTPYGWTLAIQH